jgi:hypothetical protein
MEIGSLYEQELQALNEDLRRQAAVSMFQKLQPTNRTTVEQFLQSLRLHKDVWSTVATMGIVDFADAINDGRKLRDMLRQRHNEPRQEGKRTRLNDPQKQALKGIVLRVLADAKEGMSRNDIAKHVSPDQIIAVGVNRQELANKLRQPLSELVREGKIHTIGEKRLMRYLAGTVPGAAPRARKEREKDRERESA